MLKQRILTAAVLIAVLIAAINAPTPWVLVLILCLMASAAMWEWLRLSYSDQPLVPTVVALIFAVLSFFSAQQWVEQAALGQIDSSPFILLSPIVIAYWILGAGFMLALAQTEKRQNRIGLSLFGVVSIAVAWAALVDIWLYEGAWFLFSMLAVVWVADITAYFTGKAFGKRKLAPRISPGKTWAGVGGAIVGVIAWILLSSLWAGSFGERLIQQWSWVGAILLAIVLTALSIIGDLFESLLKRRAGYKDSSQLLPGHGGVLDRIDALIPVAPLAAFIAGPWLHVLFTQSA